MAKTSRYTPIELLELARQAVSLDPEVRVATFREEHGIGSNEAQAVLTAAKFERGHGRFAKLSAEDLHPRFRALVTAPATNSLGSVLDLRCGPDALRSDVDRALDGVRDALGAILERVRHAALQAIGDAESRAADDARAAETALHEMSADVEAAQRREAEGRADAAQHREQLSAEVGRLTQEVREQIREREHCERALTSAELERTRAIATLERERAASRATEAELTRQLADAQRAAGAAERHAASLTESVADLRHRLDSATEALSNAMLHAALCEARESAANARAEALSISHKAELLRLHDSLAGGRQTTVVEPSMPTASDSQ